eukprot:CAMPEP_0204827520 /NCGR_PEP_ID=MMETSP1346-20131115/4954_1 /ASSEMBLY_ACC=CAM_ASM_000771 /TAXON_ID=215587 /ORGANISM="Aplanochytrium stocchinoi, Strain GSBS06" /LENGTH=896 /DNA_ID=CAMNT_0051955965 /DNA_START=317 /DNA_END=3007 /DNA_ORIENTATION=-
MWSRKEQESGFNESGARNSQAWKKRRLSTESWISASAEDIAFFLWPRYKQQNVENNTETMSINSIKAESESSAVALSASFWEALSSPLHGNEERVNENLKLGLARMLRSVSLKNANSRRANAELLGDANTTVQQLVNMWKAVAYTISALEAQSHQCCVTNNQEKLEDDSKKETFKAMDSINKLISGVENRRDQWNAMLVNMSLVGVYLLSKFVGSSGENEDNGAEETDSAANTSSQRPQAQSPKRWLQARARSLVNQIRAIRPQGQDRADVNDSYLENASSIQGMLGEVIGIRAGNGERSSRVKMATKNVFDTSIRIPLLSMLATGSSDSLDKVFGVKTNQIVARSLCKPDLHGDVPLAAVNNANIPPGDKCSKLKIFDPSFMTGKRSLRGTEDYETRYRNVSIPIFGRRKVGLKLAFAPTPDNCVVVSRISSGSPADTLGEIARGDYLINVNKVPVETQTLKELNSAVAYGVGDTRSEVNSAVESTVTLKTFRYADVGSLLDIDMFVFTVALSGCVIPDANRMSNFLMIIRSVSLACLVQGVIQRMRITARIGGDNSCRSRVKNNNTTSNFFAGVTREHMHDLWKFINKLAYPESGEAVEMKTKDLEIVLLDIILPYLKKCAILLSLMSDNPLSEWRKYTDPPQSIMKSIFTDETGDDEVMGEHSYELSELDYLWHKLGIPSIMTVMNSGEMLNIMECWIQEWRKHNPFARSRLNVLTHPTDSPSECCWMHTATRLIPLPQRYETLYGKILQDAKCPTKGGKIEKPALCLRCGVVVCSSSKCCRREASSSGRGGIGAATQHVKACCGGTGAMLLPLRCQVLLLRGSYAVFVDAPYVDQYGETDPKLERGRPLVLDVQRYKKIEDACMSNSVASWVNRERNNTPNDLLRGDYLNFF